VEVQHDLTHVSKLLASHTTHLGELIFASVTGSHAYGYSDWVSDYDVHGAFLYATSDLLGLNGATLPETFRKQVWWHRLNLTSVPWDAPPETPVPTIKNSMEIQMHELKKMIFLMLKGNATVLEDLYSPLQLSVNPAYYYSSMYYNLKVLALGCITKRIADHYLGMAANQRRTLKKNNVKSLLHMYRCLLMGIHCMRTGEILMNVPTLAEAYQYQDLIQPLIDMKLAHQYELSETQIAPHLKSIAHLERSLAQEKEFSTLPDAPSESTHRCLDDFLLSVRLKEPYAIRDRPYTTSFFIPIKKWDQAKEKETSQCP
jgi:predicted nucleotidyltransferase